MRKREKDWEVLWWLRFLTGFLAFIIILKHRSLLKTWYPINHKKLRSWMAGSNFWVDWLIQTLQTCHLQVTNQVGWVDVRLVVVSSKSCIQWFVYNQFWNCWFCCSFMRVSAASCCETSNVVIFPRFVFHKIWHFV